MREYQRTTRECKFTDFSPETIQALRKYFEKHELGEVETGIIMSAETDSTPLKLGFFGKLFGGGNLDCQTAIFFNSDRLFWCTDDHRNQPTVLSAKLREIEVKDFASDLIEDSGIEIFGFVNQSHKKVVAFIGFGEETFALEFKKRFKKAVEIATID
jgi:hypothetical protein